MVLDMKNKPYLSNTPPIREMTTYMFESWKHISKQEDKIICIENGLDIYPSGRFGINYELSEKYDARYEYQKLMIRIYEAENTMELILSEHMTSIIQTPSMQAILELPQDSQDKILAVFTKVIANKLAEHNNKGNSSNSD